MSVGNVGALELSLKSQRAWLHGEAIDLSPREFNILQVLAKNPDSVVSKRVVPPGSAAGEPVEEKAPSRFTCRICAKKIGGDRIKTHRGIGYQFVL